MLNVGGSKFTLGLMKWYVHELQVWTTRLQKKKLGWDISKPIHGTEQWQLDKSHWEWLADKPALVLFDSGPFYMFFSLGSTCSGCRGRVSHKAVCIIKVKGSQGLICFWSVHDQRPGQVYGNKSVRLWFHLFDYWIPKPAASAWSSGVVATLKK